MILFPDAYVLSEAAAGRPLNNSRIGWHTYTRGLSLAAATASSSEVFGPADAPLRPDTFEFWQPQTMPATWTVDLGTAYDVDYVGIAGHTIGSSGASVEVSHSTDGLNWTSFAAIAPGDNLPLMFVDDVVFARYWRITVSGSAAPQIAVIYVGKVLAMERAIYGGVAPPNLSRDTVLKNAMSRGGRFLGQNYRRNGVKGNVSFTNLTPGFIRDEFDLFVKSARRFPYFFAWRPLTYPREITYAWTDKDFAPSNKGTGRLMEVGWSLRGIGFGD